MTQSKLIIVCYVNGQPKGLMSEYQFMNYTSKRWWDKIEQIEVPKEISDISATKIRKELGI